MKKRRPVDQELFEKWLPVFQDGQKAKAEADEDGFESRPRTERVAVRERISRGDDAFVAMYERIMILAERKIQSELAKPRAFHVLIERDDLVSAAYEGIYDALCKMDLEKTRKSPTNYVLQWVSSKVTRAALKMEASTGLSPSKLRLYKKIAAVRRVVKKDLGRAPTDEELLDYFHSGQADLRTMDGKAGSNRAPFASNANIRLSDIQEQGQWDDGYNLHTPVTDTYKIDAEIHHDDDVDVEDGNHDAELFWRGYMDHMGISADDQNALADELQLFRIAPTTTYDDATRRRMGRDFIRLIQHPQGGIRQYSRRYIERNGDGFWRAFAEMMTADEGGYGKRRKERPLRLSTLKIHARRDQGDID